MNEFVCGQGESIIGHGYERYISFVTVWRCSSCCAICWD